MCLQEVGVNTASEQTLLHIAEILSAVASTSRGRMHLLYGENGERFSKSKSVEIVELKSHIILIWKILFCIENMQHIHIHILRIVR